MAVVPESMEKMMHKVQAKIEKAEAPPVKLGLAELQENIRVSEAWVMAIEGGTFKGADTPVISGLLSFIKNQHDIAQKSFETEKLKQVAAPEWGKPEVKSEATA